MKHPRPLNQRIHTVASLDRIDLYAGIGDDEDRCGRDRYELAELAALDCDGDGDTDTDDVLTDEEIAIIRACCE